jgi:hypothetical protein
MNKLRRFQIIRRVLMNRNEKDAGFVSHCCDRIGRKDLEDFLALLGVSILNSEIDIATKQEEKKWAENHCDLCRKTHYHCSCERK